MSSEITRFYCEYTPNSEYDEIVWSVEPQNENVIPRISTFALLPTAQQRPIALDPYLAQHMEEYHYASTSAALETITPSIIQPWTPTTHLKKMLERINDIYLAQYPCWPCAYCGILLYSHKAKRELYDHNYPYPLKQKQPNLFQIIQHNGTSMVPCCNTCGKSKKCWILPHLPPIPEVIKNVPEEFFFPPLITQHKSPLK